MFQRISCFYIFKDILLRFIPICTPVILYRLDRHIHLICPFGSQLQIFVGAGDYETVAAESEAVRTRNMFFSTWTSQCRQWLIGIVRSGNIRFIPCEVHTEQLLFPFRHVGIPILFKSFHIDQLFVVHLVEISDTVFEFFVVGREVDRAVIIYDQVIIIVADSECAEEELHVFIPAIVDERNRDFIGFAVAVRVLSFECFQYNHQFIRRLRHLQA